MVTEAEALAVLAEAKVITDDLVWIPAGVVYHLQANVLLEESGETLSLRGYVGSQNRSFALLYREVPIRKYTAHPWHIDPVTKERVTAPHKHTWDDVYQDRRVYLPGDIRIGDPNEELMDFLGECNITLRGAYLPQRFRQLPFGGPK
jgi:hypothetical protein